MGKGITNNWTKQLGQILSSTFPSRAGKGNPISWRERESFSGVCFLSEDLWNEALAVTENDPLGASKVLLP